MNNFRWLHLSDFHTGKDDYGQIKLFEYIIEHMKQSKEKGFIPDVVFITGDIANKGLKEEYDMFCEEFLIPLSNAFETRRPVYIVMGNHDIDRNQCRVAAKSLYSILNDENSNFFDTDKKGEQCRKEIFSRFQNFQDCFNNSSLCFPTKEIFEEKGYFADILSKGDKKIGIVGINTAWLSNSHEDKENLTPGKYILEEALNKVKDCEYKIVLGHHPLDWLQGEQQRQIKTLLVKYKAMYLHGHLHMNCGEFLTAYNRGILTLQSGAAFQERENKKYYNSLQWGELNFQNNKVRIMPKKWSATKQEFILDSYERLSNGSHKDGQDYWQFPYVLSDMDDGAETDKKQIKALTGWCLIDQRFINKRKTPSGDEILKYFDGKEPSYNDIFSSYIPAREMVSAIKNEFIRCNDDNRTKCVLITGAGGEGKTTVLLQTVRELTENNHWKALVLRHSEKNMDLQEESILELTKKGNWIICVDNCFPISGKLFQLLVKVSKRNNQNVHFLLCARDIDWNNSKSGEHPWRQYSDYSVRKLRGINEEDAEKIVTAWGNWGAEGLGELSGLSTSEAKKKLYLSAKSEMDKNESNEGALLGAMLMTRHGEELKQHVYDMLLRLQEMSAGNSILLDAFACIVAMHSKKLYFLSKTVMAQLYHFAPKDVKKYILTPLGDEAAAAVSGELIYTRHILIAQAARKILEQELGCDFEDIYHRLTIAAMEAKKEGVFIERFSDWKYIGDNFMDEDHALAIRLCQSVLKVCPGDPHMLVHLSKLFRKLDEYDMALALFRDVEEAVDHRSFFCEWALAEAIVDNKFTSICLSALAMSDHIVKKPMNKHDACVNLYTIAITFYELYTQFKEDDYLRASLAAIKMGEKIDINDKNIQKFINDTLRKFDKNILGEELEYDKCLQKGIMTAKEFADLNFKEWIPCIDTLQFKRLFDMAGIKKSER